MSAKLFKATVNEHLEGLPESMQSRLYEAPATCLSIYRLLPPIAKFYVMLMVFTERPIAIRDLDKWCKPGTRRAQVELLKRLKLLHLILEDRLGQYVTLHPTFRNNFRDCLTGCQRENAFGNVRDDLDDNLGQSVKVTIPLLDSFAQSKWESILHYMVGTDSTPTPSKSVLSLLRLGGLMEGKGSNLLRITNEGFQFLLQDVNAQIWTILLQYLDLSLDLNMDPVEVLNFIFTLGSLELGKAYTVASLSTTQVNMLADLKDYGLIYQRTSNSGRFYPTRLATTLTSELSALVTGAQAIDNALDVAAQHQLDDGNGGDAALNGVLGTLIVETNFKIYAYTNSPLEIAILNLFVNLKTRFANMVCGQITRESIRKALFNGITAQQIVKFLETHAHPQMKTLAKEKLKKKIEFDTNNNINTAGGAPQLKEAGSFAQHKLEILPPTVVDQIKLWQLELDRIQTFEGYLFKDFANQHEYDALSSYASEIGVLLWSDKVKRKFYITELGKLQVIDFANRKLKRERV